MKIMRLNKEQKSQENNDESDKKKVQKSPLMISKIKVYQSLITLE